MKISPDAASSNDAEDMLDRTTLRKSRTKSIQDGHGDMDVVPTSWEKTLAGDRCCCCPSPCVGCFWGFMCVLIPVIIGSAVPMLKLTDEFGWQVVSHPLTQAHYAHEKLVVQDLTKVTSLFPEDTTIVRNRTAYNEVGVSASLLYVAKGTKCPRDKDKCDLTKGNLLSTRNMELIRKFEDKLYNDTKYQKYCLRDSSGCTDMMSFAQYNRLFSVMSTAYRSAGNCAAFSNIFPDSQWLPSNMDNTLAKDATLDMICNPETTLQATCRGTAWDQTTEAGRTAAATLVPYLPLDAATVTSYVNGSRPRIFPKFACEYKSAGLTNIKADGVPFLKSYLPFGFPVDRNVTGEMDYDEEEKRLQERYSRDFFKLYTEAAADVYKDSNEEMEVLVSADSIIGRLETEIIQYIDMSLMAFSFVMVFGYMWFTTGNLMISGMGMIQIVFSLGPPFLIWLVIIKPSGIQFFQLLSVFLILGIGADDVFVLNDAWNQTKKAMLKELKEGETLDINKLMAISYRQAFSAMLSTTATTALCFVFGSISGIPFISWVSFFAAMVVTFDFVWCITLLAATMGFNERTMSDTLCCCFGQVKPRGQCGQQGCCWGCVPLMFDKCKAQRDEEEEERSGIERVLSGPFFNFVNKAKVPLLVFWFVVVILMIVSISLGVGIADSNPDSMPKDHPISRRTDINAEYFSSEYAMSVNVFWGFQENPVKEWEKTNEARELNMGSINDAISAQGQQKILDLCEAPDNDAGLRCEAESCTVRGFAETRRCPMQYEISGGYNISYPATPSCNSGRNCIMELVKEFALQTGDRKFPVSDLSLVMSSSEFRNYLDLRFALYRSKGLAWKFRKEAYQYQTGVFFDSSILSSGAKIKHLWVSFNATFTCFFCPAAEGKKHYDKWDNFVKSKVDGTGQYHLNNIMFLFKVFQDRMVTEALTSMGLAIGVSLVTMCFVTWNWVISLIGTFNIVAILAVFIGTWPALGWKFDMYTCLFLIMAVGMSVDYTLHILHAYNESSLQTRYLRTKEAVSHMGVTVFSGAITTLLAAAPMFGCTMTFFNMFGTFIFLIILYSILLALLLLLPILLLFGPEGHFGDIWCFYALSAKMKRSNNGGMKATE
eukprot:TRINITY_DN4594_c0_g1_i1.p1 TRINITY_DN4594_c0_g1~~TRINITY_DN4594_c0_g1_i1.p1  ORF type:complete len:1110 (+),score=153.76 TRINITY_DN4594_c0_g1_i1:154-3483(+)